MCLKKNLNHNPLMTGIKLTLWEWWRAAHFISPSHDFFHSKILRELLCIFLLYKIGPSSSCARLASSNDDVVILSWPRQGTDLHVWIHTLFMFVEWNRLELEAYEYTYIYFKHMKIFASNFPVWKSVSDLTSSNHGQIEFLTRAKIVSSNQKPQSKRIVFSRAFSRSPRLALTR